MNEHLRNLLTSKREAQTILDFKRQRAETLRRAVDATPDEIIQTDIDHRKAFNDSLEADKAYDGAINAVVDGNPSGGKAQTDTHEALLLARSYIYYVKDQNPHLHREADGTPSVEQAVEVALEDVTGRAA